MKRFVLATNRTTQEQDAKLYQLLRERWPHLGWWHQVSETWLFVDLTDSVTAAHLRDAAMEAFPGIYTIVLEVEVSRGQWAGFGPTSPPLDMFTWIRETWNGEE